MPGAPGSASPSAASSYTRGMLRRARAVWRHARSLPLLAPALREIDRLWWARTIAAADVVDLDYVRAQGGPRSSRAAIRHYTRVGYRTDFALNPLFMERLVSSQLPDAGRVPALYAYLISDAEDIEVSVAWDAVGYSRRVPGSRQAQGRELGHGWRAARSSGTIRLGRDSDGALVDWSSAHRQAREAAAGRVQRELPPLTATSSCAAWLETRGCPRVPSTKPSAPPTAYLLPSSWPSRQEARSRRQRRRCSVPLGRRRSSCSTMNFSSNVSKTLRSTARPSWCVDHTARSPPSRSSGSQNRPRKALSLRYGSAGMARWPPPDGVCTVGVRFIFCRAHPARTPSLSARRYTLGASQARPSPAVWESGRRHTGLSRNSSFVPPPRTKTWTGMLPEPPIRTFTPSSRGEDGRSPTGGRQGRRSSVGRPPFRLRTVDASRRCVGP